MLATGRELCVGGWPLEQPRYYARPFGSALRDLDVDFRATRPTIVTALIDACVIHGDGRPVALEEAWRLPVSERTQALLALLASSALTHLRGTTVCNANGCNELIELEVSVASLGQESVSEMDVICGQTALRVRLPNGEDQYQWAVGRYANPASWYLKRIVLSVNGQVPEPDWMVPDDWQQPIADQLASADPLTALDFPVTCPACGHAFRMPFDIEMHGLRALEAIQAQRLDEVHLIASTYHWPERDIMAMPYHRRNRYLQMIRGRSLS